MVCLFNLDAESSGLVVTLLSPFAAVVKKAGRVAHIHVQHTCWKKSCKTTVPLCYYLHLYALFTNLFARTSQFCGDITHQRTSEARNLYVRFCDQLIGSAQT